MSRQLIEEFEAEVRATVVECHRLGYSPSEFEETLRNKSAYQFAKEVAESSTIHSGLRKVVAMGYPELAVESIMLRPKLSTLFSTEQKDGARWRLTQAESGI